MKKIVLLFLLFILRQIEEKLEPPIENEPGNNKILPIPDASAFFIFSKDSKFRIFCHWLANHRWFGNSVLVCILVSSSLLAAEDPVRSGAPINEVIYYYIILF